MLQRVLEPLSQVTVMVVEDDAMLRRILGRSLGKLGVHSVVVDGSEAALRALEQEPFSLAFIDAHLVGETGEDVVRKLNAVREQRPKFICISAACLAPQPGADGFDGFDSKPATVEQMRALLLRWLA